MLIVLGVSLFGLGVSGDSGLLALVGGILFTVGLFAPGAPAQMTGAEISKLPPFDVSSEFRGLDVVGESHYQDTLEREAGGRTDESADIACMALLIPQTNNKYDPNAVAVVIGEEVVGYLPRHQARRVQPRLLTLVREGRLPVHPAKIVGGWDRDGDLGHFGVKLIRAKTRRSSRSAS